MRAVLPSAIQSRDSTLSLLRLVTLLLLRLGMALLGGGATVWALRRWLARVLDSVALEGGAASAGTAAGSSAAFVGAGTIALHSAALALPGALLAFVMRDAPPGAWSQGVLLTCLLYALAVTDLRTLHVPLPVVFGGMGARVAYLMALERPALLPMLLGLFAGAGMLTVAGLAYETVRGRAGLGQGDAAVLGMIGGFVGWQGLVPALLGAAVAGLIVGGGLLLILRKPLDTPLPFAPFLAAGGWAVYTAQAAGWLPV